MFAAIRRASSRVSGLVAEREAIEQKCGMRGGCKTIRPRFDEPGLLSF
jgi:hypothetical protein